MSLGGFKIYRDTYVDTIVSRTNQILPSINSNNLPQQNYAGNIAYETTTQKVYYNNGSIWQPINNGIAPTSNYDYSIVKSIDQTITPATPTILSDFSITPNPPYFDNLGDWDLVTGIFTASVQITIKIEAYIAWKAGITNLGNRTLQIVYRPAAGIPYIAKEATTQADPNTNVETAQDAGISFQMNVGDQCWVQVVHTAPINLVIASGNHTTIYG